ncbi:hypothetical protein BJ973_004003 [Actinoplanes tereljensis]|uniref:Uncharacterized protein n=1 Tax=Paractinoplanes tereljensis TaxID=571912 RepID=A0A919NUY1_9ACTN|nr:hypothetical protein [Actinoplanes tereljensis]GIF25726.1 hypothetical protein Ate02nite_84560 [Actinoplanes tereljensis]
MDTDHTHHDEGPRMAADPTAEFLIRAARSCHDQADDLYALTRTVLNDAAPPRSPADGDHRTLLTSVRSDDRQQLWHRIGIAQINLIVHTTDHLRTLGTVLAEPRARVPVYAHAALARAAVESSAMLLHLLATGSSFPTRLARGVALLLTDADEAVRAAKNVEGNAYMASPAPAVTKARTDLIAVVERARITRVPNGNRSNPPRESDPDRDGFKAVRIMPDGIEEPAGAKISVLIRDHFADLPGIYPLLSGVVHGLPWGLGGSMTVHGRDMTWEPDPIAIGGHVLAAVTAASRTGAAFAAYRGVHDPVVTRLADRAVRADRALAAFGKATRVLAGAKISVEGLVQRSDAARRRATS